MNEELILDEDFILEDNDEELILPEEEKYVPSEEEIMEFLPRPRRRHIKAFYRISRWINSIVSEYWRQQRIKQVREELCRIKDQYPYLEVDTAAETIPYSFKVDKDYRSRRMMECCALYPQYQCIDVNHYSDYKDYVTKLEAAQDAMAEACRTEIRYKDLKIA